MVKALVIYDTLSGNTRSIAEQLKARLEDLGMTVDIFRDKKFRQFNTVQDYDVIALGAPCHWYLPALTLTRKLKPLFAMDLIGKKLITFASSGSSQNNNNVVKKLETLMTPTKITPVTSLGCEGKPPANFKDVLEMSIQEEMF